MALVVVLFLVIHCRGQGAIVNVNTGYALGCSFGGYHDTSDYYQNNINGGVKFGLDLGYQVDKNFAVDLSLSFQKTTMPIEAHFNGNDLSQTLRAALLWVQAGGTSYFPANHFEFLFGTYLGVVVYHFYDLPPSNRYAPVRFAWSVKGGMGYFATKTVGLIVRTDALFSTDPLREQFATPGLSNGKTGFNTFFQLNITTGVTVRLFRVPEKTKK